jgi:hypothetical protein
MPLRSFKSTAFAPIAPVRSRLSGYEYRAFPVNTVENVIGAIITLSIDGDGISPDELLTLDSGEYTVTIFNTGDETLLLDEVVLVDPDMDGFVITQPLVSSLSPGESTTFTITVP